MSRPSSSSLPLSSSSARWAREVAVQTHAHRLAIVLTTLLTLLVLGSASFGVTGGDAQIASAQAHGLPNYVPGDCAWVVRIRPGQTLAGLVGARWRRVAAHDRIPNPNRLYPGSRICLAWRTGNISFVTSYKGGGHASSVHATVSLSVATVAATNNSAGSGVGLVPEPCSAWVPASLWGASNYHYAWAVPAGCYATIYFPSTSRYVSRPGFGWCNWWAQVTRPDEPTLLRGNAGLRKGTAARPGATVIFPGGMEGASWDGHYAHVEAVSPDGRVALISEMNFAWRGGGFGRVNYRFIALAPGLLFIY